MAAALILVIFLLWKFVLTREQVIEAITYIRSFGAWTVLVFFFTYVVLVTLSFPLTILNITSGILFGIWVALGVSVLAAITGACLTFLFARHVLKDQVERRILNTSNGKELLDLATDKGWKLIIMLRLNPFIPAVVKNYGFGVTDIPFSQYAWASFVGQVPLVSLYTYLGWIGGHAMLNEDSQPQTYHWLILAVGIIFSIAITIWVYRYTHSSKTR